MCLKDKQLSQICAGCLRQNEWLSLLVNSLISVCCRVSEDWLIMFSNRRRLFFFSTKKKSTNNLNRDLNPALDSRVCFCFPLVTSWSYDLAFCYCFKIVSVTAIGFLVFDVVFFHTPLVTIMFYFIIFCFLFIAKSQT